MATNQTSGALRGFYLAIGADEKLAIAALNRLDNRIIVSEKRAQTLLLTLSQIGVAMGPAGIAGRGGNVIAAQLGAANVQAKALHATLSRPVAPRGVGGSPYGRGLFGTVGSAFMGTIGAALPYMGARAFGNAAGAQSSLISAAQAGGITYGAAQRQARGLMGQYKMTFPEAATLVKETQQLGLREKFGAEAGAALGGTLAGAGAAFNIVETSIAADVATAGLYRLGLATSRNDQQLFAYTKNAMAYAGAIKIAGDNSAAGAGQVFEMLGTLQQTAQGMGFTPAQLIALSGGLASISPDNRELFRTAILRFSLKNFADPAELAIGSSVAAAGGVANFQSALVSDPFSAITGFARGMRGKSPEERMKILQQLFPNVRDIVTLNSVISTLGTIEGTYQEILDPLKNQAYLQKQVNEQLGSMGGSLKTMRTGLSDLGMSISLFLAPGISAAANVIASIATGIAEGGPLGKAGVVGAMAAGALAFFPSGRGIIGRGFRSVIGRGTMVASGEGLVQKGILALSGRSLGASARLIGAASARGVGGMAARGGLGFAGLAGGPVGWIVTALSVLEPVFGRLAGWMGALAEKGGALGAVGSAFRVVFNILELGGAVINRVFGFVWDMTSKVFNLIGSTGIFDKIGQFFDWIGDFIERVTNLSRGKGWKTDDAPKVNIDLGTTNISTGSNQAAMDALAATNATRSSRLTSWAQTQRGGA